MTTKIPNAFSPIMLKHSSDNFEYILPDVAMLQPEFSSSSSSFLSIRILRRGRRRRRKTKLFSPWIHINPHETFCFACIVNQNLIVSFIQPLCVRVFLCECQSVGLWDRISLYAILPQDELLSLSFSYT